MGDRTMSSSSALLIMLHRCILALLLICSTEAGVSPPVREDNESLNKYLYKYAMEDRFPGLKINMDKLIREYTDICPYLTECDRDHLHGPAPMTYNHWDLKIPDCQPCSCGFKCKKDGNCCPGNAYQYLQYESVPQSTEPEIESQLVYVIGKCPTWYNNADIINRCTGDRSIIFPVSSLPTYLTYKNKFCAECHNESSLYTWPVSLACYNWVELPESPAFENIMNTEGCWIDLFPKTYLHDNHAFTVESPNKRVPGIIDTCNVTRLWKDHDAEVKWACENMDYLYRGFKNVFCYICNPSIGSVESHPPIAKCNVTGNWKTYRQEILEGCELGLLNRRHFPFNNIYCKICNEMNGFVQTDSYRIFIEERAYPPYINISIQFSRNDSKKTLYEITDFLDIAGIRPTAPFNHKENVGINNTAYILTSYQSVCGIGLDCNRETVGFFGPNTNSHCSAKCSCSSTCAEFSTCCPEVLLRYSPYDCMKFLSFPSWRANLTKDISQTLQSSDISVVDACIADEDADHTFAYNLGNNSAASWINFPVRSSSNILYKNMSYFLCNTKQTVGHIDIQLHCNNYIEYEHYTDIVDMLITAKEHCSIFFVSKQANSCKAGRDAKLKIDHDESSTYIFGRNHIVFRRNISHDVRTAIETAYLVIGNKTYTTCNETQIWATEHPDIKSVCKGKSEALAHLPIYQTNGFTYKNFACFLCNPVVREEEVDRVISSCNVTGAWTNYDSKVAALCNTTEYNRRWLPFKNYYCSECNLPQNTHIEILDSNDVLRFYRYILQLTEDDLLQNQPEQTQHIYCFRSSMKGNGNECRQVLCSNGHMFDNGRCTSLPVEETRVYLLPIELQLVADSQCPTGGVACLHCKPNLVDMLEQIYDHINKTLRQNGIEFCNPSNSGSVNTICELESYAFNMTSSSELSISFTFLPTPHDINLFETMLSGFLDAQYAVTLDSNMLAGNQCTITLQTSQPPAHLTPEIDNFQNQSQSCMYSNPKSNHTCIPNGKDIMIVDRFLLCPQLEFGPDEFKYDHKTKTLVVNYFSATFELGHFKRQGSAVRVCLDDFKKRMVDKQSASLNPHYVIFSYIVISISLISLMMTFAVYCTFSSLRTLPGKNIMVLVFCLFFAQSCLAFGLRLESGTVLCQALGMLIHFFWLATFCAMNVCAFHLFEVFWKNTLQQISDQDAGKRFKFYLLYIFLVPMLVVTTTICVNAVKSDGSSFGYAENLCFLSDINASIIAFVTPSALLFVSNVILFALAFHKIRTSRKMASSVNTERNDVFICARLCALIGITWPLYFIDSIIGFSYLTYVIEGINSLQGLLIFLSYICNKRIFALFNAKFHIRR